MTRILRERVPAVALFPADAAGYPQKALRATLIYAVALAASTIWMWERRDTAHVYAAADWPQPGRKDLTVAPLIILAAAIVLESPSSGTHLTESPSLTRFL